MMMQKLYTITELAQDLDMTPRAIRFYEDKGLITPQRVGSTRAFTHRDRGRLILIQRGKRLGFTLREIGEWLDLYDADPNQVNQMQALLGGVEERIALLEQQRDDLEATLSELKEIARQVRAHLEHPGDEAAGELRETSQATPRREIA